MRNDPTHLALLCCPACQSDLHLEQIMETAEDGHVMQAVLCCLGCTAVYPVLRGVPRFVPDALTAAVAQTVSGFGYQWQAANEVVQNTAFTSAQTFLDFISPVQPDYFAGKVVLDGGCGLGRFTHWASQFGAKTAVGVDLSLAVDIAFNNLRHDPHVLIVQGDLFHLPLKPTLDYAFSVGVLHHTPAPRQAFGSLASRLKPGGGMSAWVYGRENNGWIIHILNPIRQHITSRLPRPLLQLFAYLLTIPLFIVLKTIYRPVGKSPKLAPLKKLLFYFEYLYFLGQFGFHEQALIVFDHLVPSLADYIAYAEFADWFAENHLQNVVITSRAGNSWRGFGEKEII